MLISHNTMIPIKNMKAVKAKLKAHQSDCIVLAGSFKEIILEGRKKDVDSAIELLGDYKPLKRMKPLCRYDFEGVRDEEGDWIYYDDFKELLISLGLEELLK